MIFQYLWVFHLFANFSQIIGNCRYFERKVILIIFDENYKSAIIKLVIEGEKVSQLLNLFSSILDAIERWLNMFIHISEEECV